MYRGPGAIVFGESKSKLVDGLAVTTASFSRPGEYILQVVVDDGSGEAAGNFGYHCCWTNAQVTLTVKGADSRLISSHSTINQQSTISNQQSPTFTKDVAPIFQKSCQTSHHARTSAPISLVTYDEVRPWARSIRQRVAARDMP